MPRDTAARQRVTAHLLSNGPVHDSSGRATSILKEAVGYQGGDAGFSQLIMSMEKAGELRREIRGRRTYRISANATAAAGAAPTSQPSAASFDGAQIDYDELATTLLTRAAQVLSSAQRSDEPATWARRRIEQLEARVDELQRDLARARAEAKTNADEREELRGRLDAASHNLSLLTERVDSERRPQGKAAERLGRDEQALLYELRGHSNSRPGRAG